MLICNMAVKIIFPHNELNRISPFHPFPYGEKIFIFTIELGLSDTCKEIVLFVYSDNVSFRFRVGFVGNPFFRFYHHFGGDSEIVISIVADVELSGFEEAPFFEEVGQIGFRDVAACPDEFELVFDGIIPSVVSRVVAQVFHDVRVEVGMFVFGKVEMELPQGDQLVEDIL